jgi:hypothetical protein
MSAHPIGEIVKPIIARAQRIALISELIETFDDPSERKAMIMALYQGGAILDRTAELLIDHYGLEAA